MKKLRHQYCSCGRTHGAIIILRNVSLEDTKSICAQRRGADDSRGPAVKLKLKPATEHCSLVLLLQYRNAQMNR